MNCERAMGIQTSKEMPEEHVASASLSSGTCRRSSGMWTCMHREARWAEGALGPRLCSLGTDPLHPNAGFLWGPVGWLHLCTIVWHVPSLLRLESLLRKGLHPKVPPKIMPLATSGWGSLPDLFSLLDNEHFGGPAVHTVPRVRRPCLTLLLILCL